jgi:hypothetical protein
MSKTCVVNMRRGEAFDVRIDRMSIWGNRFVIGRDGDRATVIAKYAAWIMTRPELLSRLHELRGKRLGCWCSPLPCHGDVLVRLVEDLCEVVDDGEPWQDSGEHEDGCFADERSV